MLHYHQEANQIQIASIDATSTHINTHWLCGLRAATLHEREQFCHRTQGQDLPIVMTVPVSRKMLAKFLQWRRETQHLGPDPLSGHHGDFNDTYMRSVSLYSF